MSEEKKLNGTVIVTYRCNARCSMCNRYKAPSKPEEEISIDTVKKLPKMYFTNITGGEPFIRTDLKDIVRELYKKSDRIVISTNGFFTERIVDLCKEFPQIGIRISIEGLEQTNNEIRGLQNGYQRGYNTLKKLREMGMKDVGFGMTVQDKNAPDLVPLYRISNEMGMEFATASPRQIAETPSQSGARAAENPVSSRENTYPASVLYLSKQTFLVLGVAHRGSGQNTFALQTKRRLSHWHQLPTACFPEETYIVWCTSCKSIRLFLSV